MEPEHDFAIACDIYRLGRKRRLLPSVLDGVLDLADIPADSVQLLQGGFLKCLAACPPSRCQQFVGGRIKGGSYPLDELIGEWSAAQRPCRSTSAPSSFMLMPSASAIARTVGQAGATSLRSIRP